MLLSPVIETRGTKPGEAELEADPAARRPPDQQIALLDGANLGIKTLAQTSASREGCIVIETLHAVVEDVSSLNSKLVLLIGTPRSGKSNLLGQLAARRQVRVLSLGPTLGRELLAVPSTRRHLQAAELLKDLADEFCSNGLLLMDNIELLFDRTLQLSPLDLLKRHAHAHRVVAVWPGDLREDRLSYATTGHPEHRDYGIDGLVPFKIQ